METIYIIDSDDEVLEVQSLMPASIEETFECPVCFEQRKQYVKVTLPDCCHSFCSECMKNVVSHSEDAKVRCPYTDGKFSCKAPISEETIKALVDKATFELYLKKLTKPAENNAFSHPPEKLPCRLENCGTKAPQSEMEPPPKRPKLYDELVRLHSQNLVSNPETFECPVCLLQCEPAEGATLQACLHSFCKRCLENAVQSNETGVVKCLYKDEDYSCNSIISEKEIKSLVNDEIYKLYLARSNDRLQKLHTQSLVLNMESFQCSICFQQCEPDSGAQLQECLHAFCKPCIESVVKHSDEISVKCPYIDAEYSCQSTILEKEIKALVDETTFDKYLARSLNMGEVTSNSFHCKTPDCKGWCIVEDAVNYFTCTICEKRNCIRCQTIHTEGFCPKNENETLRSEQVVQSLTMLDGMVMSREGTSCPVNQKVNCAACQAIHEGMDCQQYRDDVLKKNHQLLQSEKFLNEMTKIGKMMPCPKCKIMVEKIAGCDWLQCRMCKTEICWATRGPRWGPRGLGDISGGCRCNVGGVKCRPNCGNCH